jgi:hypothetical protein
VRKASDTIEKGAGKGKRATGHQFIIATRRRKCLKDKIIWGFANGLALSKTWGFYRTGLTIQNSGFIYQKESFKGVYLSNWIGTNTGGTRIAQFMIISKAGAIISHWVLGALFFNRPRYPTFCELCQIIVHSMGLGEFVKDSKDLTIFVYVFIHLF